MRSSIALVLAVSLPTAASLAPLVAQTTVIPAHLDAVAGPEANGIAGAWMPMRQQIVVDAVHADALTGRTLTSLSLRRNPGGDRAGGQIDLVVRLGVARIAARAASTDFAANVTNAAEVFSGLVSVPASPATATTDWSAQNRIDVPFANAWTFPGGGLVVDLDGRPVGNGVFWPIDAASDLAVGAVQSLGGACGPIANARGDTAHADPRQLVPGSTLELIHRGPSGASAFALFGVTTHNPPIDLGFVGAPGCALLVDGFAAIGSSFGAAEFDPRWGGLALVAVPLPAQGALLGRGFYTQWVALTSPITVSNTLACSIAPALPMLGMATVTGAAGHVAVDVGRAAVMRFGWR